MTDREMLEKVIEAWESLPGGTQSVRRVQDWISGPMTDMVDATRVHLGRKRPDGSDPSQPQRRY